MSPSAFMGIVGIVVGLGVLAGYARLLGWVAGAWLIAIALNLVASGRFLDVAARDVALAVSAFALARLAPVHEPAGARRGVPAEAASARAHA